MNLKRIALAALLLAAAPAIHAMLKRLDVAVFDIAKAKQEGSFKRGVFTYGLKNGGVGLSWSDVAKKNIPAEVQQQLKDLEQQIVDGKIVVEDVK